MGKATENITQYKKEWYRKNRAKILSAMAIYHARVGNNRELLKKRVILHVIRFCCACDMPLDPTWHGEVCHRHEINPNFMS